jgi:xanthine dehydrogenase accessory factor
MPNNERMRDDRDNRSDSRVRGLAVVLGTGEIASAIGVHLHRMGWGVAQSHDPETPVLRRGMAFYDALFGDAVMLDGIVGRHAASTIETKDALGVAVAVTPLDLMNLIVIGPLDVLIDARLQPSRTKPDLRWLSGVSIGVGPDWHSGKNCDIAVGLPPEEISARHFVGAPQGGYWYTPIEPGTRVYKHLAVGKVNGLTVRTPCDGVVLGILRDGLHACAGMPLLEIDSGPRGVRWRGVGRRAGAIGKAVTAAAEQHLSTTRLRRIPVRTF